MIEGDCTEVRKMNISPTVPAQNSEQRRLGVVQRLRLAWIGVSVLAAGLVVWPIGGWHTAADSGKDSEIAPTAALQQPEPRPPDRPSGDPALPTVTQAPTTLVRRLGQDVTPGRLRFDHYKPGVYEYFRRESYPFMPPINEGLHGDEWTKAEYFARSPLERALTPFNSYEQAWMETHDFPQIAHIRAEVFDRDAILDRHGARYLRNVELARAYLAGEEWSELADQGIMELRAFAVRLRNEDLLDQQSRWEDVKNSMVPGTIRHTLLKIEAAQGLIRDTTKSFGPQYRAPYAPLTYDMIVLRTSIEKEMMRKGLASIGRNSPNSFPRDDFDAFFYLRYPPFSGSRANLE